MAQQGQILLPSISSEVFNLRFPDNFLTPALSSIDTLYSASAKSFYFKQKGDSEAITVNIDFQSLNNPFVTNNSTLATP